MSSCGSCMPEVEVEFITWVSLEATPIFVPVVDFFPAAHLHISTNNEKLGRLLSERKSTVASDEIQAMNSDSTSAVLETRRASSWNSAFLGSRKPYPDVYSPDFASTSKELQSFLPCCVCIPLIIPSTYPLHWVPNQSSRLWVRASLRRSPRRTC